MKRAFFSGLLVLLPLVVTFWVIGFIVDIITAPFDPIIDHIYNQIRYYPFFAHIHFLIPFIERLIFIGLTIFVTIAIGFVANKYIVRILLGGFHRLLRRVPLIRWIYQTTKDVLKQTLKENSTTLGTPVVVNFPSKNEKAFGFHTGKAPVSVGDSLQSIFVPTAPHPISGFLLLVPESEFKAVALNSEDVFKFLISCGTYDLDERIQNENLPLSNKTPSQKTPKNS